MAVKPIPDGYHTVTPYLIVKDGLKALEFYKQAFGATELFRIPGPDGKIGHAEIKIGDSVVMLADEQPGSHSRSPQTLGGSPVGILLYLDNVDSQFKQALAAAPRNPGRCRTSSTAIGPVPWRILSDIPGPSQLTLKM